MSKPETLEPKKRTRRTQTDDNKVKKGGKKKAAKDPNAPKRGLTAYLFFANEQRDKVKAENPDLNFAQLNSLLGVKWKESTPEGKAPYEKKAQADKERYEKQKAEYESKKNQPPQKDAKKDEDDDEDEDDE